MKTTITDSVPGSSVCDAETENLQSSSESEDDDELFKDCLSYNTSPAKSDISAHSNPSSDDTYYSSPEIEDVAIELDLLSISGDGASTSRTIDIKSADLLEAATVSHIASHSNTAGEVTITRPAQENPVPPDKEMEIEIPYFPNNAIEVVEILNAGNASSNNSTGAEASGISGLNEHPPTDSSESGWTLVTSSSKSKSRSRPNRLSVPQATYRPTEMTSYSKSKIASKTNTKTSMKTSSNRKQRGKRAVTTFTMRNPNSNASLRNPSHHRIPTAPSLPPLEVVRNPAVETYVRVSYSKALGNAISGTNDVNTDLNPAAESSDCPSVDAFEVPDHDSATSPVSVGLSVNSENQIDIAQVEHNESNRKLNLSSNTIRNPNTTASLRNPSHQQITIEPYLPPSEIVRNPDVGTYARVSYSKASGNTGSVINDVKTDLNPTAESSDCPSVDAFEVHGYGNATSPVSAGLSVNSENQIDIAQVEHNESNRKSNLSSNTIRNPNINASLRNPSHQQITIEPYLLPSEMVRNPDVGTYARFSCSEALENTVSVANDIMTHLNPTAESSDYASVDAFEVRDHDKATSPVSNGLSVNSENQTDFAEVEQKESNLKSNPSSNMTRNTDSNVSLRSPSHHGISIASYLPISEMARNPAVGTYVRVSYSKALGNNVSVTNDVKTDLNPTVENSDYPSVDAFEVREHDNATASLSVRLSANSENQIDDIAQVEQSESNRKSNLSSNMIRNPNTNANLRNPSHPRIPIEPYLPTSETVRNPAIGTYALLSYGLALGCTIWATNYATNDLNLTAECSDCPSVDASEVQDHESGSTPVSTGLGVNSENQVGDTAQVEQSKNLSSNMSSNPAHSEGSNSYCFNPAVGTPLNQPFNFNEAQNFSLPILEEDSSLPDLLSISYSDPNQSLVQVESLIWTPPATEFTDKSFRTNFSGRSDIFSDLPNWIDTNSYFTDSSKQSLFINEPNVNTSSILEVVFSPKNFSSKSRNASSAFQTEGLVLQTSSEFDKFHNLFDSKNGLLSFLNINEYFSSTEKAGLKKSLNISATCESSDPNNAFSLYQQVNEELESVSATYTNIPRKIVKSETIESVLNNNKSTSPPQKKNITVEFQETNASFKDTTVDTSPAKSVLKQQFQMTVNDNSNKFTTIPNNGFSSKSNALQPCADDKVKIVHHTHNHFGSQSFPLNERPVLKNDFPHTPIDRPIWNHVVYHTYADLLVSNNIVLHIFTDHPVVNHDVPSIFIDRPVSESSVPNTSVNIHTSTDGPVLNNVEPHTSTGGPVLSSVEPHTSADSSVSNRTVPHTLADRPAFNSTVLHTSANRPASNGVIFHTLSNCQFSNSTILCTSVDPSLSYNAVPYTSADRTVSNSVIPYTSPDRSASNSVVRHTSSDRPISSTSVVSHTSTGHLVLNNPLPYAFLRHPTSNNEFVQPANPNFSAFGIYRISRLFQMNFAQPPLLRQPGIFQFPTPRNYYQPCFQPHGNFALAPFASMKPPFPRVPSPFAFSSSTFYYESAYPQPGVFIHQRYPNIYVTMQANPPPVIQEEMHIFSMQHSSTRSSDSPATVQSYFNTQQSSNSSTYPQVATGNRIQHRNKNQYPKYARFQQLPCRVVTTLPSQTQCGLTYYSMSDGQYSDSETESDPDADDSSFTELSQSEIKLLDRKDFNRYFRRLRRRRNCVANYISPIERTSNLLEKPDDQLLTEEHKSHYVISDGPSSQPSVKGMNPNLSASKENKDFPREEKQKRTRSMSETPKPTHFPNSKSQARHQSGFRRSTSYPSQSNSKAKLPFLKE